MSSKKNKGTLGKVETLISQDTLIEGYIEASGTIRVDGTVKGGVKKAEGVIIGETGMVEGNICAECVSLAGNVKGNIRSQTSLELMRGSSLTGDIETTQLSIAEGAHFDGVCTMIDTTTPERGRSEKKQPEPKKSCEPGQDKST